MSHSTLIFWDLNAKRSITLYDGMTFGRSHGNETFPDDDRMSRTHFRINIKNGKLWIEDLGSTNKTSIDGKFIEAKTPLLVNSGGIVEFGMQKFQLMDEAAPAAAQSAKGDGISKKIRIESKESRQFKEWLHGFLRPKNWGLSTSAVFVTVASVGLYQFLQLIFNSALTDTCTAVFLPFAQSGIFLRMVVPFFIAAVLAASVQFGIGQKIRKRSLLKLPIALAVFSVGSIAGEVLSLGSGNPEARFHTNQFAKSCACTADINRLPLAKCQKWIDGKIPAESTSLGEAALFINMPSETQTAAKKLISEHPLGSFSELERTKASQYFIAAETYLRSREYERAFTAFEEFHRLVPNGLWNSKSMQLEAEKGKWIEAERRPAALPKSPILRN